MDEKLLEYTKEYIEKIKLCEDYIEYKNQAARIKNFPDLMEKINAYRDESFIIQRQYEGEQLYDKMEEFNERNEKLLEDPHVYDFLHAEAGFCRLMQDINMHILEGLEFE